MFNDLGTCQDLLYRRARALADYENSNKALDKARLKSKDIPQAEEHQQQCLQKFDKLSESGKKGWYIIRALKDARLCLYLFLCVSNGMHCAALFFFFHVMLSS